MRPYREQRRLFLPLLPFLLGLGLSNCGGTAVEKPVVARTQSKHSRPDPSLPASYRGQVPALVDAAVLNYLPDTSMAAMLAKSPRALAEALESTAILHEYGEAYAKLSGSTQTAAGAKLFEPQTWSALGINADEPAGAAMIVEDGAAGLFFVSLSDRKLFRAGLDELAARLRLGPVKTAMTGDGMVLLFSNEDDIGIVIRGDVAILVVPDRRSDLPRVLERVVGGSGEPSLASTGRIAQVFAGFDHGEDLAGFIAFDSIAAKIHEEESRRSGHSHWEEQVSKLEAQIATAKVEQRSQEVIGNLEDELRDSLQHYNRQQMRQAAESRLLTEMIGELGTVALGIDLRGPTTRARAQLRLDPGSLPGRLLAAPSHPIALPGRLTEPPLFLIGGHFDRVAVYELLDLLLRLDGETPTSFAAELRSELGIELEEILSLFAGELAGAVTFNTTSLRAAKGNSDLLADSIGMHVLLQLQEPSKAQALLHKISELPALRSYAVNHAGQTALELPSFNDRKIRIEVTDGYLQARSTGDPAPFDWKEGEQELLEDPQASGVLVLDPTLLSWMVFAGASDFAPASAYYGESRSKLDAQRAKRREELAAELATLRARKRALQTARMLDSGRQLGRTVLSARRFGTGVAVFGGLFGEGATLGRSIQRLVEAAAPELESERTGRPSEAVKLQEEISKLAEERWRLYEKMQGR